MNFTSLSGKVDLLLPLCEPGFLVGAHCVMAVRAGDAGNIFTAVFELGPI